MAAAQQLAAQLIRLQVRYYALQDPQADAGAQQTLLLLVDWEALQKALQVGCCGYSQAKPACPCHQAANCSASPGLGCPMSTAPPQEPRAAGTRRPGRRLLEEPLKLKGASGSIVEMKLFDDAAELDTARTWLGTAPAV